MKSTDILTFIALAAMLMSCYKEAPIHSERGESPYKVEDSSDPSLHYIYEFNQKTGVYILTEYSDVDFKWDIASESNNNLVRIKPEVLEDAIGYVKSVLTEVYPEEFAKKFFPLKVLLADSIKVDYGSEDAVVGSGRSYIALGGIRKENLPKDDGQLREARGEINGYLWGNIIYSNNLMTIPEGFFSPGEDYYGVSFEMEEFKDYKDDPEYPRKIGFWRYDPDGFYPHINPSRELDVSDFVRMIITHSSVQMEKEMDGFENLRIKYDLLIRAVKESCGVDLQAIGDKYSKE
mgnify:CR=1 FL=1